MDTVVCPFCFRPFSLVDAPLRRTRLPADSPELVIDPRIQAYFGPTTTPVPLPPLIERPRSSGLGRWWRQTFPDRSWTADHNRCCPHCGLPLPLAIATGELKPKVIAIIGDRASGKSIYIAMLINQLVEGQMAHRAGFSVVAQNTFDLDRGIVSSRDLFEQRYRDTLFGQRSQIPSTGAVQQNPGLRSPLIYRLNFDYRSWWHRLWNPWSSHRALDLVLFDTAGEDLEDPNEMDQNYRYLVHASAIIFLVDPTRLSNLVPRLDDRLQELARQRPGSFGRVLDSFINLMERHGGARAERNIRKPVAFAMTKLDELRSSRERDKDRRDVSLLDASSPLQVPSRHVCGFDTRDGARVSAEVKRLLQEWGGVEIGNLRRFTDAGYFALTALGHRPDDSGYIARLQPERVVDPLFWALYRLGYLPPMR